MNVLSHGWGGGGEGGAERGAVTILSYIKGCHDNTHEFLFSKDQDINEFCKLNQ